MPPVDVSQICSFLADPKGSKADQKHMLAAGAQKRASFEERYHREALGRSRGGYGTKVCVIADKYGKALDFALVPGQVQELPLASAMLDSLPAIPLEGVADKGYASNAFRERIWDMGARPAIPAKRHYGSVACSKWAYRCRHLVENLWARLKEWRTALSQPDTKKQQRRFSRSSTSLPQQTESSSNSALDVPRYVFTQSCNRFPFHYRFQPSSGFQGPEQIRVISAPIGGVS